MTSSSYRSGDNNYSRLHMLRFNPSSHILLLEVDLKIRENIYIHGILYDECFQVYNVSNHTYKVYTF